MGGDSGQRLTLVQEDPTGAFLWAPPPVALELMQRAVIALEKLAETQTAILEEHRRGRSNERLKRPYDH